MLDSRMARSPGSLRNAAYGSAGAMTTTSRARWKMALASSSPRAWLSCRTTRARRVTCTALSATTARPTMAVTAAICLALMPIRIAGSRDDFLFLLLSGYSTAQPIEFVVERLEADAEDFGRARLVVARVLERHQDQAALGFLDGSSRFERHGRLQHVGWIGH